MLTAGQPKVIRSILMLATGVAAGVPAAWAQSPTFVPLAPLYFTMPAGGSNPLPQTITILSTGGSLAFSTSSVQTSSGGNWLQPGSCLNGGVTPQVCPLSVNGTGLTAGSYAGQVVFSNNSAQVALPVTLTVADPNSPLLSGLAGALTFTAGNFSTGSPQTLHITNAGGGALNWTASASVLNTTAGGTLNWLSVSATRGTAPSQVTVSVSPQGLSPGIYSGQILFQSTGGNVTVPVALTVVPTGGGGSSFRQLPNLSFNMPAGGNNPMPQTVEVLSTGANFGFTTSLVQTSGGGNWLHLSGCANGGGTPQVCSVSVDGTALRPGDYSAQAVFSTGSMWAALQVELTVTPAGVPALGSLPSALNFVAVNGSTGGPRTVQVYNSGGGVLNWTATPVVYDTSAATPVNWLSVGPGSGTAPTAVTVSAAPAGLTAGIYTGEVLFESAGGDQTIPVSLIVAGAGTNTFQQLPDIILSAAVGAPNPLPQVVRVQSTLSNFAFSSSVTTVNGGAWLQVSGCANTVTPANCSISINALPLSTGIYVGQVTFSSTSSVMIVPVTLIVGNPFATTPMITSGGVVPVYSSAAAIQPGEWVSIYGTNLAIAPATWNGDFPKSLGGTSVTVDGKAAYLWFVSPGQINLQAPDDTVTGPVPVVVTTPNGTSTATVTLASFGPSFSLLDGKHVAGIILRTNGSGAYGGGAYDIIGPGGSSLGFGTVPAKTGDTVALFGVGFGPTIPFVPAGAVYSGAANATNPVKLTVNGLAVTPTFAGVVSAGLYQINLVLPAGIGTGDVSLRASVGGVQTPAGVVLSVQ